MNYRKYPYNVVDAILGNNRNFGKLENNGEVGDKEVLENLICELISSLPQERQRAFLLYYRDGLSITQIAEQENLSCEEVNERVGLTLRHLRHPNQIKHFVSYKKEYDSFSDVVNDIESDKSVSLRCLKLCYQICRNSSDNFNIIPELSSTLYLISTLYGVKLDVSAVKSDDNDEHKKKPARKQYNDELYTYVSRSSSKFLRHKIPQFSLSFDDSPKDLSALAESITGVLSYGEIVITAISEFCNNHGIDGSTSARYSKPVKFSSVILHCLLPSHFIPFYDSELLFNKVDKIFHVGECDLNGYTIPDEIKRELFERYRKTYDFLDAEIKTEKTHSVNHYIIYCAHLYALACYLKANSKYEYDNLIITAINIIDHISDEKR